MWETVSHKFRNKNLSWSRETFFFLPRNFMKCAIKWSIVSENYVELLKFIPLDFYSASSSEKA